MSAWRILTFAYLPVPDWQDTLWKLLPLITALIVVFVGYWLTGRAKRREWLADNQKEEYRRVLAALNGMNMLMLKRYMRGAINPEEINAAMEEATVALNTSIFIADFLEETKVVTDVIDATREFVKGGTFEEYRDKYWKSINLILTQARKITI